MYKIRYVIASTPRSATGYSAKIFNNLGLNCTHEGKFNPWVASYHDAAKTTFGDSSWMAVPHLDRLPPNTLILHQVRDPLATLNSNLKPHLTPSSLFANWDRRPEEPYSQFIWDYTQNWTWADNEKERIMQFWCGWHKWIEYAATKRSDLRYVRFSIEDLNAEKLHQLAKNACLNCWGGNGPGLKYAARVLKTVPTNFNHHGKVGSEFTMDNLSDDVKSLAVSYGYSEYIETASEI